MCGIIALVSFKNHSHNLGKLNEMAKMIKHRGPDDEGFALFDMQSDKHKIFSGDDTPEDVIKSKLKFSPKERYQYNSEQFTLGLAHRRLSIIDLSASGHQPMCDESGRYWITYNGEIYNFKEIREELRALGYPFFSNSDTEVIVKAYMAWGKNCQNKFNGMWAFVIWDNVNKSMWISRDRFGVKPLYYMFHDDFFVVCSEIKCVLKLTDLAPNYHEIHAYLLDGPSEAHPETFFDQVYRFPAGVSATYAVKNCENQDKLIFEKYWVLQPSSRDNSYSEKKLQEYSKKYYYLLEDSVKLRLFADVNVSCALSGGLDSSSITYLAHHIWQAEGGKTRRLSTVSNIYNERKYSYCDESKYIDMVVNSLNIKSYRSEPDEKGLYQMNDYGLWYYENCYEFLPVQMLNTFQMCKKNNIKVNLDGQGADETSGGYNRYWRNYFSENSCFSKDYILSLLNAPISLKQKIRAICKINPSSAPGIVFGVNFRLRGDPAYRSKRIIKDNYVGVSVNASLHNSINFNLKNLLRDLDTFPMACSVESRQPFMDYRLITFINSIPSSYKLRNGWTKYLARIAFSGKLPASIVWRRNKLGWPQPIRDWIAGSLGVKACEAIKKNEFIEHIIGKISDDEVALLMHDYPRAFLRLFNLTRHHELFFNNGEMDFVIE